MIDEPARLRDFAARYTAAWCSRNAASVAAFYSPDGSLSVNGGTPAVGRTGITEVAQGFMIAFPDLQVLMDDVLVQGGRAVYHWTFIGANTRLINVSSKVDPRGAGSGQRGPIHDSSAGGSRWPPK